MYTNNKLSLSNIKKNNASLMKTISILIACHNRRQKTINCLSALFKCGLPDTYQLEVFLVDDASTDGTFEAVRKDFPKVNVIVGNGNLFWNKAMRLAWETAAKTKDFDFYLWLNDDTILDSNALCILLETYEEIIANNNKAGVLCGACRALYEINVFSYGGRTDSGPVIPNSKIQSCKYINGNIVLVPSEIFHKIGYLSPDYTHIMGDIDYGMRVLKNNFNCYTTKTFIATCPPNEGIPSWCNPQISLKRRWELLHSPKGLNIREYILFRKKFWKRKWILYTIQAYLKTIHPNLYNAIVLKLNRGPNHLSQYDSNQNNIAFIEANDK